MTLQSNLSQRLGQRPLLSARLQQSLRLLELPADELRNEIQAMLDTNPALQVDANDDFMEGAIENQSLDALEIEDGDEDPSTLPGELPATDLGDDHDHERVLPTDIEDVDWDEFQDREVGQASQPRETETGSEFQLEDATSLRDHLLWQVRAAGLSDRDEAIGLLLIDALDAQGFLMEGLGEVLAEATALGANSSDVERVLEVLQECEPTGVASRSASEYLQIQLGELSLDPRLKALALCLARDHVGLLAHGSLHELARQTGQGLLDVGRARELIRRLPPCPFHTFGGTQTQFIEPDVIVRELKNGDWGLQLCGDHGTSLYIDHDIELLATRLPTGEPDARYLGEKIREARSFLDALEYRCHALLSISRAIVEHQKGFLERGDLALRPMTRSQMATEIGVHESTVSRIAANKYMGTPQGTVPIGRFFSARVSRTDGEDISSTAIRAMIKSYVDAENPAKPLTDSRIVKLLQADSVSVARRTVAKYREAMSMPPAHLRKRAISAP